MDLTGQNFIGNEKSSAGKTTLNAVNPATGKELEPSFYEATSAEVDRAAHKAEQAFELYRKKSGKEKAAFLEAIAEEILALGDELIQRCMAETGLPEARLTGERGRTMNQLKLFASVLREGSWLDARIDLAQPGRQPIPKPDIRSMQKALGPVGIFGASNFPLAFSVAGGDTASALAAGCTIVVKAHPAHPGTCELIGNAVINAIQKIGMPEGTFNMVYGTSVDVGMAIVKNPLIKAIGFTGSFRGGKALFDAASQRPEPIPVYAEMGSTNPVFILSGALKDKKEEIAKGLTTSVTLGVGQFCTNPGLVFLENSDEANSFKKIAVASFKKSASGTMLTSSIQKAYENGAEKLASQNGVELLARGQAQGEGFQGIPFIMQTSAKNFLTNKEFEQEVFGPSTLTITADEKSELLKIAENLGGHLTTTIWANEADLDKYADLIDILERKAGRLIINGFPTGVEVCHAMIHGGPFPATTDSRTTSVGTTAIRRFTRPVCYQNFPDNLLPDELKNDNPLNIWRLIDGEYKK
jgi:alpha-ketoglutaric semialdehyde dehydrogenase